MTRTFRLKLGSVALLGLCVTAASLALLAQLVSSSWNRDREPNGEVHCCARSAGSRASVKGIHDHMVELSLRRGQPAQAFMWAERARARSILQLWSSLPAVTADVVTATELSDRLKERTTLLAFTNAGEQLVCWVFEKGDYRFVRLDIKVDEVERESRSFLGALQSRAPANTLEASSRLYEALIKPLNLDLKSTLRLVSIPSPQLMGLPFSALFDLQSNSYLIEQVTIATAPSATLFLLADERRNELQTRPAALVVGAPELQGRYPDLLYLPGADHEADTIAELLTGSRRLSGMEATRSNVLDLLPGYTAFHFAGHGLSSPEDSNAAALVLSPEGSGDGLIMLDDIFSRVLNGELAHLHLVSLSACGTLVGAGRDGPLGVGQAFFAAGVPRVVGTLWPIEDEASAELMIAFYRNLQNHLNVAQALRQGILEQIRNSGPYSDPAFWAAFAVIGG